MELFADPGPRVFTIAPGLPFARALADGVVARLAAAGAGPEALADVEIVVSTRRAARAIRSAFIAACGGVALGPRLKTLAELGADEGVALDAPAAIDPTARRLALTRLVRALLVQRPDLGATAAAPGLAADLEALLDAAQASGARLGRLDAVIAEARHAEHWRVSSQFLDLIRTVWPAHLDEIDRIDPAARNRRAVAALETRWADHPPRHPVIVAGSTGSLDTSAWFIELVSRLPQGAVVLPGLDQEMDADCERALREHGAPEHPQAGLIALIDRIGTDRAAVADWAPDRRAHAAPRLRLLSQALRPAPVTDAWRAGAAAIAAEAPAATEGLALLEAGSAREEAAAIAIALRGALETPERTAALITPDRTLARRVASELARWGVEADDSSGRPLALTPPGVYFSLVAETVLSGFAAAPLLSLLKHPLTAAGRSRGAHLRATRRFEDRVLRRRNPGPGLEALRAAVADAAAEEAALRARRAEAETDAGAEAPKPTLALGDWFEGVLALLAPLSSLAEAPEAPFGALTRAHAKAALELATAEDAEASELYRRDAGEALETFVAETLAQAEALGPIAPGEYPAIIGNLMAGRSARRPHGLHARVLILGSLEARMQSADLVILAGLNEGVWPQTPQPDAWISRDMRAAVGLPPLESRIGLSAHDFFQAAMAARVILSRARKADGAPTVPSRWLLRLTTLLEGVAPDALAGARARGDAMLARARAFAAHQARAAAVGPLAARPARRPAPRPPVALRPRDFSVTEVETLIRDPYAVYARRVLRLRPLDPLEETPDARARGQALHAVLERFVRDSLTAEPDAWPEIYDRAAEAALAPILPWPTLHAAWRARAARIRDWFLAEETRRRAAGRPVALEATGRLSFDSALGPATLTAQADRIDLSAALDGSVGYAIYDYKTGAPPSRAQIEHFAKQLPLEAAILTEAGFAISPELGGADGARAKGPVAKIAHLRLKGGAEGGEESAIDGAEAALLAAESLDGLKRLIAAYANPDQGYPARLRPEQLRFEGAYDHLARFGEWTDGAAAPAEAA